MSTWAGASYAQASNLQTNRKVEPHLPEGTTGSKRWDYVSVVSSVVKAKVVSPSLPHSLILPLCL